MTGKTKNGWGGAREGSGQPKKTVTAVQAEQLIAAFKKFAIDQSVDPGELLAQYAYGVEKGKDFPPSSKLKALEKYYDLTMAKIQEGGETDKQLGPNIYLPEEDPDPAKVVSIVKT